MICVAISDKDPNKCMEIISQVEMAEIRLDLTNYDIETVKKIFSVETPLIATCRPENLGYEKQYEILKTAIESGAAYVDIEIEAPEEQREKIIKVARQYNCRKIISYHNYEETPNIEELNKIAMDCYCKGGDVAKLAVQANTLNDASKILSLYAIERPVVALAMGEFGKITRIMSSFLGAEFTFASTDEGIGTAPGQINYSKMIEARKYFAKLVIS